MSWPNLNKPPIVVAIFQIKYNLGKIKLSDFNQIATQIGHDFPIKKNNIHVDLNFGETSTPLEVSPLTGTAKAKIESYIYSSTDQKSRLEISENTITYIDEHLYIGWDNFKSLIIKHLSVVAEIIGDSEIVRTSIRFINRFNFNNFDNPLDYFTTLISTDENVKLPYPLRQYGFRLLMDVPDTDIYSIVNQNVENMGTTNYIYTFDIDVLDKQRLLFDVNTISENLEILRKVKNDIFFNNITKKTRDLCS